MFCNENASQHPPTSYQAHINIKIVLHSHGWVFKWVWLFIREQWTCQVTGVRCCTRIVYFTQLRVKLCLQMAEYEIHAERKECGQLILVAVISIAAHFHASRTMMLSLVIGEAILRCDASNVNYSFLLLFIIGFDCTQSSFHKSETFFWAFFRKIYLQWKLNWRSVDDCGHKTEIFTFYRCANVPLRIFFHSIELLKMQF